MTKSAQQKNHLRNSIAASLTALLFIAPLTLKSQEQVKVPSRPLTLNDYIALALNENPLLDASRLNVASATEKARAARDQTLPQLTATGSAQLFSKNPTNRFSIVNVNSSTIVATNPNNTSNSDRSVSDTGVEVYSAHLSYPLFKDDNILSLNTGPVEAGKLTRKRNLTWTSRLRREKVIARIIDAFITTVSAENQTKYAERRVKLLNQQVDITQEQQKQSLMLPIDLKLAQSQLSGAQTLAKILRQQAVAGKITITQALSLESPDKLHLSNSLPKPPDPPSAEKILSPATLAKHPSLEVQKAVIDQARQDYRLERFRLYPSVTLQGSAVHIDDFGSSGAKVYSDAVAVDVPIFDFDAQMSTTQAKLAKYQTERAHLSSVAGDVTYEIVTIYQSIYVLSQNILSLQQEVAKTDRDLQVIRSQQQAGISPPLTTIEKELHLIAKRDNLDGIEVRRLMLYATLQKATDGS